MWCDTFKLYYMLNDVQDLKGYFDICIYFYHMTYSQYKEKFF